MNNTGKINWLMDCKFDQQDILKAIAYFIQENIKFCCYELYDSVIRGLLTIRNSKIVINHFIPKSILEKNLEPFPEISLEQFNLEPYQKDSDYYSLVIDKCCFCFKPTKFEFDLKNINYNNEPGANFNIKYFSQEQLIHLNKYKFCCKDLEKATLLGFFTLSNAPQYYNCNDVYELSYNHAVIPKKVGNIITGEVYDPEEFYGLFPLVNCIYCNTKLIEEYEDELF